jgi:hypothetical protein
MDVGSHDTFINVADAEPWVMNIDEPPEIPTDQPKREFYHLG